MPGPGLPLFDLIGAGLLACPSVTPSRPVGQWQRMSPERKTGMHAGFLGLTATGIAPEWLRIPFSRLAETCSAALTSIRARK